MPAHSQKKAQGKKKRSQPKATADHLRDEDLDKVAGGIETIPLPEVKGPRPKMPKKGEWVDPGDDYHV